MKKLITALLNAALLTTNSVYAVEFNAGIIWFDAYDEHSHYEGGYDSNPSHRSH